MKLMVKWFVIWTLFLTAAVLLISGELANECPTCNRDRCVPPTDCTDGTVLDMCFCCRVCARIEGQTCGGRGYMHGECAKDLTCIARDIRDHRNRRKNDTGDLTGRCEAAPCNRVRCSYGQRCFLRNGLPHCACPADCHDTLKKPVCGDSNAKIYANECDLKRDECRQGKKIGLSERPCMDPSVSHVTCTHHTMSLTVRRSFLGDVRDLDLTLLHDDCVASVNATHVTLKTLLKGCGTRKWFTLTSVIYSNVVRNNMKNATSNITRKKQVYIPFECEYRLRQRNRNRVMFRPIDNNVDAITQGNSVRDEFNDVDRNARSPRHFAINVNTAKSYTILMSSRIFHENDYKVMPSYCYAVPVPKEHRTQRKILIANGCPTENSVRILPSDDLSIKLSVPQIEFVGCKVPGFTVRCKLRACIKAKTPAISGTCDSSACHRRQTRTVRWPSRDIELDTELEAVINAT